MEFAKETRVLNFYLQSFSPINLKRLKVLGNEMSEWRREGAELGYRMSWVKPKPKPKALSEK